MSNIIPYEKLGLTLEKREILAKYIIYKKQVESFETELKDTFKALVESGDLPVTSVDIGGIKLSYKTGYSRSSIDTDKLKEDGIYDKYTKTTLVKPSVSMIIPKDKEN